MFFSGLFIAMFVFLFINADQTFDLQNIDDNEDVCGSRDIISSDEERYLFYDIDPTEGFNLRRDVYMRFAIMLTKARIKKTVQNWRLVLSPWHGMYHWKSQALHTPPKPWSAFYDVKSLKSYAPVLELSEVFSKLPTEKEKTEIDVIYILQVFKDPFEGGIYVDKWEIYEGCEYDGNFWGYKNITAKEIICVRFQGQIKMLWELVALRPLSKTVMFANSQIIAHKSFNSKDINLINKNYWDCRKSIKFSSNLHNEADTYLKSFFNCHTRGCPTYISVHWRRLDFIAKRTEGIPSVNGTATQIHDFITELCPKINKIYVASDATENEFVTLKQQLVHLGYQVYRFSPSKAVLEKYLDGGIAIIDQIICSRAAYFIGTHESTFTYHIQEERQILGFDPKTTYNQFCSDDEDCLKMSRWPSVKPVNAKNDYDCLCFY